MIHILNLEPKDYSPRARSLIETIGEISDGPLSSDDLNRNIPQFDALIVRLSHQIDEKILDSAKHLKVISSATTGLNHINVEYAKKKGIKVLNLKNETEFLEGVYATAEHTWALILSLIRKVPWAYGSVLKDHWDRDSYRGTELHGATLGIVGLGRIGIKVAKYALAFGMEVIAYTKNGIEPLEGIKIVKTLESLLEKSNIVTIHIPLDSSTHQMINRKHFSKMKNGAYLINTSRGEVIDENDLIDAIQQGYLTGAALDVVHDEMKLMRVGESKIVEFAKKDNRLIITPHIGGATFESMQKTEIFMAKKLIAFFQKNL